MRSISAAIGLCVLLGGFAARAGAQQHFLAGQDYYAQGRYEKAVDEFEEAYRLDPKPLLLFNIAQTHEKLGDLEKSIEYLERYLKADPKAEDRRALESKIANLKERNAATGIKVNSAETGATIFVDDKERGTTPLGVVIKTAPGTHKVRIAKPGFKDFVMSVAISPGLSVPIDVTMEPGGNAGAPALAASSAGTPPGDGAAPAKDEESGLTAFDVIPWVVAGVGAATAVVGFAALGGKAKADQDHDLAVKADIVGFCGLGVAVGGAAWGVIRLILNKKESKESAAPAAALVPVIDQQTAGLAAAIRF